MTNKIGKVLKKNRYLTGAFLIPFFLMEIIAVMMKVEPFGNQSFLIVDALHQYLPFFADYQEKLKTADSLFYSFHGGLGYNFLGLWAYYLSSPMNLIIILFPKTMLNMVLSHLLVIKIALCCFTGAFYFRKKRGKDELSIIAFGMAYGFSSYIVGYSWNIMWLEVMILLPLILYGLEKLIKTGDGRVYCIALFLSLWCNFYMSFMTCLFLVLWYMLYEHKSIKEFLKKALAFAGYSLLSGAMAAVVLIPAYLGIMQTSSAKWDFPKELWYGTFGDIFIRHFLGTKPLTMSVDDGKINLFCGILTLMMVIFYLISGEIRKSIRIRRLLLTAVMFFSFNMPFLGYIWHGFHNQYGIPNRFAYLYIFLLLSMAYDGYCILAKKERTQARKIFISLGVMCLLTAATLHTVKETPKMDVIYLTMAVAVAYTVLFVVYEKKIISRKIFLTLLSVSLMVEMASMAFLGFSENGTIDVDEYFQDTKSITKIKEEYKGSISERMDLVSGRMLDESIWHTLNCVTLFGSTAQGKVVDIMDQLGFYTGVNEYLYEGATPFTNQLLGVKYQIYRPRDTRQTTFCPVDTVGNVTVYKNLFQTSVGYGMGDLSTWNYQSLNPFEVQNDLAEKAYGISELFQMEDTTKPEINGCTIKEGNVQGEYVFDNILSRPDNMIFTLKVKEDKELYFHFDGGQVENTIIEKNGEQILTGRLNSQILYLGSLKKGDEIRIKMQLKQDGEKSGVVRVTAASLQENVQAEIQGIMESQMFQLTKRESSYMEGTISMKKKGIVFFSIPYDKGWTAYVDGKEVKTEPAGEAFLTVKVPAGKHKIQMNYIPSGFYQGIGLSIGGFLIFFGICYYFRKKKISKS